ncbi:MAG: tetratricopeptide repeat protein [Bacteroidia bacterium]
MHRRTLFQLLCYKLLGLAGSLIYAQDKVRALIQEAEQLRRAQRYEEALQKYEEAIELEPHRAVFHARRGEILVALRRNEEALKAYEQALKLYPGLTVAYARMAAIYIHQKDYKKAIEAYNQAYQYEMDADRRIQYKLRAVRLMALQGLTQEALTELANLKRDMPSSANSLEVLFVEGQLHLILGNFQNAIAAFQRGYEITQLSPEESARFLFGLALAHYEMGNMAEYQKYAQLIQDPRYRRRLQRVIAELGALHRANLMSK